MIFVTVGTHEQPFDRLIECVDQLKKENKITEDVFIQSGYSTYEPKYCKFSKLLPYSEMERLMEEARIVITHGGPASFIMPIQMGKVPIVVPRQARYNEHVNDHQVEFVQAVSERMGNILPIYEMEQMEQTIGNYDQCVQNMNINMKSNNQEFNKQLENAVDQLFRK